AGAQSRRGLRDAYGSVVGATHALHDDIQRWRRAAADFARRADYYRQGRGRADRAAGTSDLRRSLLSSGIRRYTAAVFRWRRRSVERRRGPFRAAADTAAAYQVRQENAACDRGPDIHAVG